MPGEKISYSVNQDLPFYLEIGESVEREHHGADNNEADRDDGNDLTVRAG